MTWKPVRRLGRYLLDMIPVGTPMPVLFGPLRGAKWAIGTGTHSCWLGLYEVEKMRRFAATISEGYVVYDIGANAGLYSLLASRLTGPRGKVISFEPLPANVNKLKHHLTLNNCQNVSVFEVALSDSCGVGKFDTTRGPLEGQLSDVGDLKVDQARLHDLVAQKGLPPPDVVKIDVEGEEDKVLRGAGTLLEECRPIVFLATHGVAVERRCLAIINEMGGVSAAIEEGTAVSSAEYIIEFPKRL